MAMNQKQRSLVTLAALVGAGAAIGLFAYVGVFQKGEEEKVAKEKKEKIFDFDKAKVKGVTLTAKGQTTVLNSVGKESWEVVSPVHTEADKPTVDALVNQLTQMKSKAVIEEKAKDLAKYGLDKPTIRVVLRVEGGSDVILRVGAENAFDSSMYVATGDASDVIQAEGNFKWAVDKELFDLREKRVAPFDDPVLKQLEMRVDTNRFALKKQGGKWEVSAPHTGPADETTVNKVVGALRNLRATKFVTDTYGPGDDVKYGLAVPRLEATLTLEGGAKLELVIGQADEAGTKKTYAKLRNGLSVADVSDTVLTDSNVSAFDLKDKTVLAFEKDKIFGLKLGLGAETVALERPATSPDGGLSEEWAIVAPAKAAAKRWKINSLLWALTSLKAVSFADENPKDLAPYGLDKPGKTVTLVGEGGKEVGTIAIGKDNNANVYVLSSAAKRVLEVEKSRLSDFPSSRADVEEAAASDAGSGATVTAAP